VIVSSEYFVTAPEPQVVKDFFNDLDTSVVVYLRRHEIASKIQIVPHLSEPLDRVDLSILSSAPLHIGIIGGINEAKGANVVVGLADAIKARPDQDVRLTLIGTTDAERTNFEVTGSYNPGDLPTQISRLGINLVLVPSIWPETFCYVADEAMILNIPLAVFDIGAPAERVALYPKGRVLPLCKGSELLDKLIAFHAELVAERRGGFLAGAHIEPDITIVRPVPRAERETVQPHGCLFDAANAARVNGGPAGTILLETGEAVSPILRTFSSRRFDAP
jgi:hypothetical protein